MKVKTVLTELVKFGELNSISNILKNKNILLEINKAFGEKDVKTVSTQEIAQLLRKKIGLGLNRLNNLSSRKKTFWERKYYQRYIKGEHYCLPWESNSPTLLLKNIFQNNDCIKRRVLELGCGTGLDAVFLAKSGYDVTAVDISSIAIKIAKASASRSKVSCKFINTDIFNLKPGNVKFDVIFDKGCFHHVPFFLHQDYVRFTRNLLSKNGNLFLLCHKFYSLSQNSLYPFIGRLTWILDYFLENKSETCFTKDDIKVTFNKNFKITGFKDFRDSGGLYLFCSLQRKF